MLSQKLADCYQLAGEIAHKVPQSDPFFDELSEKSRALLDRLEEAVGQAAKIETSVEHLLAILDDAISIGDKA